MNHKFLLGMLVFLLANISIANQNEIVMRCLIKPNTYIGGEERIWRYTQSLIGQPLIEHRYEGDWISSWCDEEMTACRVGDRGGVRSYAIDDRRIEEVLDFVLMRDVVRIWQNTDGKEGILIEQVITICSQVDS